MTKYNNPNEYLKNAELLFNPSEIATAINTLALALNENYLNEQPMVLCVMDGAMVFTGLLLAKLKFPLTFSCIKVTRYHGDVASEHLQWIIKPSEKVKNRKVLILDDILDEGITLKAIVDECRVLGAANIKVAVLADKKKKKKKPIAADYIGLHVDDRYIFGCGMDIDGWWRNAQAIYAMKNT